MSTVIDNNMRNFAAPAVSSLAGLEAANDAHLPKSAGHGSQRDSAETAGWNAYDVWRKLIKEARERREAKVALSL